MPGLSKPRTIIEGPLYSKQKVIVQPDARRLDEVLEATTWALARAPEQFAVVPNTKLHRLVCRPPNHVAIRIWYTYNDNTVTLLSIEALPEEG